MSKFKEFLKKAGAVVPEILECSSMVVLGNLPGAIKKSSEILKREGERDATAQKLFEELEQKKNEFLLESFSLEVEDRKHAREQSNKETNAHLQKMMAYFIVFGFVSFAVANVYLVHLAMLKDVKISEFVISSLSFLQGVFTALLFTLKDYLFGGSVKER